VPAAGFSIKKYAYPYVRIVFHSKDLLLAQKIIAVLGYGYITPVKGETAFTLTISGNKNVLHFINLVNGF
jgi:hypothetical protein